METSNSPVELEILDSSTLVKPLRPFVVMDVAYAPGKMAEIPLFINTDPILVSEEFCKVYNLSSSIQSKLMQNIELKLRAEQMSQQQLKEATSPGIDVSPSSGRNNDEMESQSAEMYERAMRQFGNVSLGFSSGNSLSSIGASSIGGYSAPPTFMAESFPVERKQEKAYERLHRLHNHKSRKAYSEFRGAIECDELTTHKRLSQWRMSSSSKQILRNRRCQSAGPTDSNRLNPLLDINTSSSHNRSSKNSLASDFIEFGADTELISPCIELKSDDFFPTQPPSQTSHQSIFPCKCGVDDSTASHNSSSHWTCSKCGCVNQGKDNCCQNLIKTQTPLMSRKEFQSCWAFVPLDDHRTRSNAIVCGFPRSAMFQPKYVSSATRRMESSARPRTPTRQNKVREAVREDEARITFQPIINKRSVDILMNLTRKAENGQTSVSQEVSSRSSRSTSCPLLSSKPKLTSRASRLSSNTTPFNVGHQLYNEAKHQQVKKIELAKHYNQLLLPFAPDIRSSQLQVAKKLPTPNIFNSLNYDAHVISSKRKQQHEKRINCLIDAATGQDLYHPKVLRPSDNLSGRRASNRLYESAKTSLDNKQTVRDVTINSAKTFARSVHTIQKSSQLMNGKREKSVDEIYKALLWSQELVKFKISSEKVQTEDLQRNLTLNWKSLILNFDLIGLSFLRQDLRDFLSPFVRLNAGKKIGFDEFSVQVSKYLNQIRAPLNSIFIKSSTKRSRSVDANRASHEDRQMVGATFQPKINRNPSTASSMDRFSKLHSDHAVAQEKIVSRRILQEKAEANRNKDFKCLETKRKLFRDKRSKSLNPR